MDVPFLVTDVGGISELLDMSSFGEAVVPEADSALLAARLQTTLERGYLPVLQLLPEVCERHCAFKHHITLEFFFGKTLLKGSLIPVIAVLRDVTIFSFCSFCYNKDESVVQQRLSRTGRVTDR